MSTDYDIVCNTCKQSLWVGQRDYLYPNHFGILEKFLFAHIGCELSFEGDVCKDGYIDISYADGKLSCDVFDQEIQFTVEEKDIDNFFKNPKIYIK